MPSSPQCSLGSRPQSGAAAYVWLTWAGFLTWIAGRFSRLGSIVGFWFPDAPLDVTSFCATEILAPDPPDIATWAKFFIGDPPAFVTVSQYLKALYDQTVWDTVCECVPDPLGPDGYTIAVLADSPWGYWLMNETSGTTMIDSSGNGRNGTYDATVLQGATPPFTGWGNAQFSTSGAQVAGVPALSGDLAIEGWYRDDSTAANQFAFCYENPAQTLGFEVGSQIASCTDALAFATLAPNSGWYCSADHEFGAGVWNHVVLQHNSGVFEVWTNGVQRSGLPTSALTTVTGALLYLAKRGASGGDYFHGKLSRVAFYNHALTGTRILAHFNAAGTGGSPYTPVPPVDPTDIPDHPDESCTTTADLCNRMTQLFQEIKFGNQTINWLQAQQSPQGWAPLATHSGLSGHGSIAASDIVGILVESDVPSRWGYNYETPRRYIPQIAAVSFAVDGVPQDVQAIHYASEHVFSPPAATNSINYTFANGVTGSITPLGRLK